MLGLTDYITTSQWEDIFTIWYVLIDDGYQTVLSQLGKLRQRGPQPACSDSEVITVALIIDTFFHGHEDLGLAFVRQYHQDMFPQLPDASRFNRRRRELTGCMEAIRRIHASWLIDKDDRVRLLDSAPIPVCTYTRSRTCEMVTGADYVGYAASDKANFFGFRLHLTTTVNQVVDQWLLAPASPHDSQVTPAFFDACYRLWVLADNGYHSPEPEHWLDKQRAITLVTPPRGNAKAPWPKALRRFLNKLRRRIETALSTLCTVFGLETTGARSFTGLLCRITTRLLAYNLSFLTNVELSALKTSN